MHTHPTPSAAHTTLRARAASALAAAALLLLAAAAPNAAAADVVREGTGERRDRLDALELTPFDPSLWSNLAEWTNTEPFNPALTDGKVVVIYTFSGFLPTSVQPIGALRRLHEQHADKGLLILGVHNAQQWPEGLAEAQRRRATFPLAHDPKGDFRKALLVDQDPDFFVIDRAGRLRYADIETASLQAAVEELLAEDIGAASALLDRLAADRRREQETGRRSVAIREAVSLENIPSLPFPAPSEAEYTDADWPKMPRPRQNSGSTVDDDKVVKFEFPDALTYAPAKPDFQGRARIVYFFQADDRANIGLFDFVNGLQVAHPRDLAVMGVLFRPTDPNASSDPDAEEKAKKKAEDARKAFDRLPSQLRLAHTLVYDYDQNTVLQGLSRQENNSGTIETFVAVVSSDGVLRWSSQGAIFNESEFEAAIERVLRVDPGVKARRAVEQQYLRERSAEAQSATAARGPAAAATTATDAPAAADPAAYAAAPWPPHNTADDLGAANVQGKPLPTPFGRERWITPRPVGELQRQVLALVFWRTDNAESRRASPQLDRLQRRLQGRALVVAVGGQGELLSTVQQHVDRNPVAFQHAFDDRQTVYNALAVAKVPHAVILSTDGVVRWQGSPLDPAFAAALEAVANADPLTRAAK